MEKELIEALNDFLKVKSEILGHLNFCKEDLADDYEYIFDNAKKIVGKALANER